MQTRRQLYILFGTFCMLFLAGKICHAQQESMLAHYNFNVLTLNPGYAGSQEMPVISVVGRQQWVGFEGAPSTQNLNFHTPTKNSSFAWGLSATMDKTGPLNTLGVSLAGAYRVVVGSNARLGIGLSAGMNRFQDSSAGLRVSDQEDDLATATFATKMAPNFGMGIHLYSESAFIGISAPRLLPVDLSSNDTDNKINIQRSHLYAMAGFKMPLGDKLQFKPTAILRYLDGAPLAIEITPAFIFNDVFTLGAPIRVGDAAGVLFNWQVSSLIKLGYAYEMGISKLKSAHDGSHEVMLAFYLNSGENNIFSPRHF